MPKTHTVTPDTLKRGMKMLGALLITLSVVTPASSVFIIAPGVMQQAGTGAFLSFAAAAIVSVFTAFIYAELASAWPLAGGEYAIVGRVLGPLAGFLMLGVNLITVILILAVISLGIGSYITPLFHDVPPVTAGIVTVAVTTLFGILNIRTNAVITGVFLLIELAALAVLAWLGFSHISRPLADLVFHPVLLNAAGMLEPAAIGMIGLATSVAIFAYGGYGQAVYLGEETHDAPTHIAHAILWALVITIVAEAVPVTALLLGAPDLKALLGAHDMLGDFIATLGGKRLSVILSLGIALAIINANIAFILMIARVLFSTGRDHVWSRGINHALTRIHKRYHSPWVATLVCGVLGACACLIDQNMLLVITGTSLVIIYAALCLAVMAGRRNGTTGHGRYRMPLYPLPPLAALGVMGYVIYVSYQDPAIGRPSLWASLGMILLSAGYYFLILRRRGDWILRGPEK